MQKYFFLFLLLISANTGWASHFAGGEMRVERQANGDYKAIVEVHRDAGPFNSGLSPIVSISIWKKSATPGVWDLYASPTANLAGTTTVIPNMLEIGRYEMLLPNNANPAFPAGTYRLLVRDGVRNASVANILGAGSNFMGLYTTLEVPATTQTNTNPHFLAPLLFSAEVGKPFHFNPIPFDKDGDSVSWSLSVPSDNVFPEGSLLPVNWTPLPAGPGGAPRFDSVTGAFTWTPSLQGRYQQGLTLKSYRAGAAFDSLVQDVQFVVLPSAGLPAIAPLSAQVKYDTAGGYYYAFYKPDTALSFQMQSSNTTNADTTFITSHSRLYGAGSNAQFTAGRTIATQHTGTFSWTPPAGTTGTKIVVFRGRNKNDGKDVTVVLRKSPPTPPPAAIGASPVVATSQFSVSPNPVQGTLRVKIELTAPALVEVVVTNMAGQVQAAYRESLPAGTAFWSPEGSLPAGNYLASFGEAGKSAGSQLIVVH